MHFGDALMSRVRHVGNPLCVGLDPYLDRIPEFFGARRSPEAVEQFCCAIIDRAANRVAVVKPQIAFFEQLGWQGMRALDQVVQHAHNADLLVLLDAKRGDIGSTASAYADAYLSANAPIAVDAITLNSYLGLDTLEPFVSAAQANGRGLFVLAKTSNPGSGDLQDLEIEGSPVYEQVAASLSDLCDQMVGPETGWSSLGVVVGATYPAQHDAVRAHLPNAIFLVPGYGAQGGVAADAVRGFGPGPNGLEGGIVNSSRGLLYPAGSDTNDSQAWEQAIDAALDRAIGELSQATH